VTDSGNPPDYDEKGFNLYFEGIEDLEIVTNSLPDGKVGESYSATLWAIGGIPPYTWSLAPGSSLPEGLSLNAGTGEISGVPTQHGSFQIDVWLTDNANPANSIVKIIALDIDENPADLPTISVGNAKKLPGSLVEIPISIDKLPNDWISADLKIIFDPNVIQVSSISNGNVFESITSNYYNNTGEILIAAATDEVITSGNMIAKITFTVNNNAPLGTSNLILDTDELILGNTSFKEIPVHAQNGYIEVINVIYGDVTGDEKINSMDAAAILRYKVGLTNLTEQQLLAAEVTGDGNVNSMDAAAILRYKVGLLEKFPIENH